MGSSGAGKVKAPPPSAPVPVVKQTNADAIEAADREKERLRKAFYSKNTILTGGGLGQAQTDKKAVLG